MTARGRNSNLTAPTILPKFPARLGFGTSVILFRMNRVIFALRLALLAASSLPIAAQTPATPAGTASKPVASAAPAATLATADGLSLFDGSTLKGWAITDFAGHGEVKAENGVLEVSMGASLSGVTWTNAGAVPTNNYEVSLEAKKIDGSDFFCGLTFPVRDSHATLVMGGWGGAVTGISSIDGSDASENETTKFFFYEKNRWYKIRVRVTPGRIEVWLDNDRVINVEITDRKISLRSGDIDLNKPLGLATYQTTAAFRNIQLKRIAPGAK